VSGEEDLLTVSHLTGVTLRSEKNVTMIEAESTQGYKLCCPGDLVINTLWAWMGAMGVSPRAGLVSPAYNVYVPAARIRGDYVNAIVRIPVFAQEASRSSKGVWASRLRLYPEEFFQLRMLLPPLVEQAKVAAFLDREYDKIDALVAEQERLIALLKEKRQAVISQAVTKGLDPNAPMKDSGIEWLGQVPTHWQVLPLRRLIQSDRRITYGIVQPGKPDEVGRYMVRGQDYSAGWADPSTIFRVSDAIEAAYRRSRLAHGDLVMTIVGAGVGNTARVPDWLDGANITQTTARLAIDPEEADPDFVAAVLRGPIGRRSVEAYAKGAAQPGLNLEHVKLFPVTVPPLDEQRRIAVFIQHETAAFEALTAEAERAIALLKERRAALISAAVTGKIDVRGLVAPAEAKAA
jgi:type I restriction enzyme S subunit